MVHTLDPNTHSMRQRIHFSVSWAPELLNLINSVETSNLVENYFSDPRITLRQFQMRGKVCGDHRVVTLVGDHDYIPLYSRITHAGGCPRSKNELLPDKKNASRWSAASDSIGVVRSGKIKIVFQNIFFNFRKKIGKMRNLFPEI